jgi:hypothetical protein
VRVLLVSRDAMLAEALESLVEAPGEVHMLDWRVDGLELALPHADVVVVDVPPSLQERTFAGLDGRFLGRTVVLLQEGESEEALPPVAARVVLYRPVQIGVLWAVVTGAVQAVPRPRPPPPAQRRRPAPMIGMSGRELEPVIGPGQVAPGMDADTLERLRRWSAGAARTPTTKPAAGPPGPRAAPRWLAGLARPAVVVVLAGVVGLGAAGWRGEGGPDLLAGEVAAVQAAGSPARAPDLLVPDPRVGSGGAVHALAVGAWLRLTRSAAAPTPEAAVRAARVPGPFLLAGVVVLTVVLSLLLLRVGPGAGAGAGRLGAAVAGLLAAADPLLVRSGRVATGTALALLLALATLAVAWAPTRRTGRLALTGAGAGLALLASPLALPTLAVPLVAALLERRRRAVGHALGVLGLGVSLWAVLPLWVADQGLGTERAGWLLGRPPGRGSLGSPPTAEPLSWLLAGVGLAAAIWAWRRPAAARPSRDARPLAWVATTGAGALVAVVLGWPVEQALAFALPAAAAAVGLTVARVRARAATTGRRGLVAGRLGVAVAVGCLLLAQGGDWVRRYGGHADGGLGRLAGVVDARLADCSAVNAGGPDERARLLAAGVNVTEFTSAPAARAAGVRYFVLTGRTPPAHARWIRRHGSRLADLPSPSLSGVQLWEVGAAALDPGADSVAVPGGAFSNVEGSACGGYRVVDGDLGAFHTAYLALGGKAVLGRPLCSAWAGDGPALQAFDTMMLGAVPSATGRRPSVRPVDLPLLLAELDPRAAAAAGIPRPSGRPPTRTTEVQVLMTQPAIARLYLGVDAATASSGDWRRAAERFGRPLGVPKVMPDGTVRQPFERVVVELPEGGGPARLVPLGRLAVRVGLIPDGARRLEPVPGLPGRTVPVAVDPGPLLGWLAAGVGLLALAGAAGVAARAGPAGRVRSGPPPGD